jgi:uncharacterized protein with GYD domain
MATYISLMKFTDQGLRNIKDSPDRYGTFKAMAEKMGITVLRCRKHLGGDG